MNLKYFTTTALCIFLCAQAIAQTKEKSQEMDKELGDLADNLASQIKEHANKKVTVVDFTDLQGASSELGRYIAEQLTVDLVISKKGFSVLDRANLNKILAEHKLTAAGLVDPENAKQLGKFAGVDAIILGTITRKSPDITLTAKIITTETAEIVGAAKAKFASDKTIEDLISHPAANIPGQAASLDDEKTKVTKALGDLRLEIKSLHITSDNQYLLTMVITNQSKHDMWTGVSTDPMSNHITDANGSEFYLAAYTGIAFSTYARYGYTPNSFTPATRIPSHESIPCTLKFSSRQRKDGEAGMCRLQLEFYLGREYNDGAVANATPQSVLCSVEAN